MFFSASTGGFYSAEIHGKKMPADVVEITDEQHALLIEGQSSGKVITADAGGCPVLSPPTAEQVQAQANAEARAYLLQTDWYVIRLQETGEAIPAGVASYRAAARAKVIE